MVCELALKHGDRVVQRGTALHGRVRSIVRELEMPSGWIVEVEADDGFVRRNDSGMWEKSESGLKQPLVADVPDA
jgi:hypothetical protein